MVQVGVVSLFPEWFEGPLSHSILGRAQKSGLLRLTFANPRDYAYDAHRTVDDTACGGGPGMVMKVEPMALALRSLQPAPGTPVVLCDAAGERFDQRAAEELASHDALVFLCGHYEGVDERVRSLFATHVYSIGDFVMTGGEPAALCMIDAVVRLRPGVLGDPESHRDDSFSHDGLLGFPLYTRPVDFEGARVPEVLLSGDHGAIAKWRRRQMLLRTRQHRPDLFCRADLNRDDLRML